MRKRSSGPRPAVRAGLLLAAMLLGAEALAQSPTLYRWVDKDGHVHYDDSGQAPGARAINPRTMTDAAADQAAQAAAAAKQAECKTKADEYNRLKAANGITQTDALGNEKVFTAEEKDKVVERKHQELVALCGAEAADTPPPAAAAPAPAAAPPQ